MSRRVEHEQSVAADLAALESGEDLRAQDRRRFSRRADDGLPRPALQQLEVAVAELRERVGSAQEIRAELVAAREVVAALRAELRAAQAELAAERVASRRARMQSAFLEAELRRREATEQHLRAALAALTEVVSEPLEGDGAATAALNLKDREIARERSLRERAERELEDARERLAALRERDVPAPAPAGPDPHAVAELRDALAELSGQSGLPREPVADGQDFDAAAARLRERAAQVAGGARRPAIELAARRPDAATAPWLRDGLRRMAAEDPARAERLTVALLAAQAGCAPVPISYALQIAGGGDYRVSVMHQGAAVGPLEEIPLDARVRGPLPALVPLAAGGAPARLPGAKVRGRRALRPLLAARRAPVQLGDLAGLLRPLPPQTVLELATLAIAPGRVDRDCLIDVVCGEDASRVVCRSGEAAQVIPAGVTAADATITCAPELLAATLAGTEPVAVDGDAGAVAALLAWIDAGTR